MTATLKTRNELGNFFKRHSLLLHFLATLCIFISAYWGVEAELILKFIPFLISVILLPGMAMLLTLRGLDIEPTYLLGISIALGLILQGLNFVLLSLTHHVQYYTKILLFIFIFSIFLIYTNRQFYLDRVRNASFDICTLTFYVGLILGLSLVRVKFAGPFIDPIEGQVYSPILERHAVFFNDRSLAIASGFPYNSIFQNGAPDVDNKPPMVFAALGMMNPGRIFPHFFPHFQLYLLGFYSIACMLATCGTRIFNRYTAVLASVIYTLQFYPDYSFSNLHWRYSFLYHPQFLAIFACLTFLLTTTIENEYKPSIFYYLTVAMVTAFVLLISPQLFLVIVPVFSIYFFCRILNEKGIWNKVPWVLPLTSMFIMFLSMFVWISTVWQSRWRMGVDGTLQFLPFGNLKLNFDSDGNGMMMLFSILFNSGCGIAIFGLLWLFIPRPRLFRFLFNRDYGPSLSTLFWSLFPRLRLRKVKCQFSHIFLWSGIFCSLFAGTFFYIQSGGSGISFYPFSVFFLIFYGADVVSGRKGTTLVLVWLVIIGVCIFPKLSRYNHLVESASIESTLFQSVKILPRFLPDEAKVLWAGNIPDRPYFHRKNCTWIVNRKCSYTKKLAQDITLFKASHFISDKEVSGNDLPDNFEAHLIKTLNTDFFHEHPIYLYSLKNKDSVEFIESINEEKNQ